MSSRIIKASRLQAFVLLIAFLFTGLHLYAQDKKVYPDKPNPPRLVNDFAHILQGNQDAELEQKLVEFSNNTSCQVSIVTVPSLEGHDINEYSVHIFNDWGLGEKGKDNGVLILVAMDDGYGKKGTFITVGKGLQGVLTDAKCSRIVRNEMIPAFKGGDYYKGLSDAATAVIAVTKDEYKGDGGKAASGRKRTPAGAIIVVVIFIVLILKMRNRGGGRGGGNYMSGGGVGDLATGFLLGNMLGGGGRGGSDGGGFGGGGFGGFGGGSTDGGGAGGSW